MRVSFSTECSSRSACSLFSYKSTMVVRGLLCRTVHQIFSAPVDSGRLHRACKAASPNFTLFPNSPDAFHYQLDGIV